VFFFCGSSDRDLQTDGFSSESCSAMVSLMDVSSHRKLLVHTGSYRFTQEVINRKLLV